MRKKKAAYPRSRVGLVGWISSKSVAVRGKFRDGMPKAALSSPGDRALASLPGGVSNSRLLRELATFTIPTQLILR